MYKTAKENQVLTGNDRFEGYSLDLIDGIAEILNFSYRFDIVPDQSYGSYDPKTKQWNGLIQQLLERVRDDFYILEIDEHILELIFIQCWCV